MLFVAILLFSFGFICLAWKKYRQVPGSDDIIFSILKNTAPVAAADELVASGAMTCKRTLNGTKLLITKDPKVADYIFNGRSNTNYVRRPASVEGLKSLGMYNRGLIWNNSIPHWKKIRACFQEALCHENINKAAYNIEIESKDLLVEGEVDLMNLCRQLTFRATLHTFFGIDAREYSSKGIDELQFIQAIISYFKAWEFFLLRPKKYWDRQLVMKHSASITELQFHVKNMISSIDFPSDESNLFVHKLSDICQELQDQDYCQSELLMQSSLEMLLAGTDTSSVTAYYALLGLAGDKELQTNLRNELQAEKDASKSKVLRCVVDETLRFKPVGPVVLREAVKDDPNFPGFYMEGGTAILVHLAEMNLCENVWSSDPDPKYFCPMRFHGKDTNSTDKRFYPFGRGPKGCIGMHLGRREVNTILATVIVNYDMKICGEGSLGSLETHWDIANQPSKPMLIELAKIDAA